MEVDPEKILAIINRPVLKNIKEIRAFFGFDRLFSSLGMFKRHNT